MSVTTNPRNDDRADHLGARGEVLQPLEEEHEVPFGSRGRERFAGVGGSAQGCASRADHQIEHGRHDGQARHRVAQRLIGPEHAVAPGAGGLAGRAIAPAVRRDAVPPEKEDVARDQGHQSPRQHAGMQGEEARQGEVAVLCAPDQGPL